MQGSLQLAHVLFWSSKGTAGVCKQPFFLSLPLPVLAAKKLALHRDLMFSLQPPPPRPSQDLLVYEGELCFSFFVVHCVAVVDEKLNCRWRYKSLLALLWNLLLWPLFFSKDRTLYYPNKWLHLVDALKPLLNTLQSFLPCNYFTFTFKYYFCWFSKIPCYTASDRICFCFASLPEFWKERVLHYQKHQPDCIELSLSFLKMLF